MIDKARLEPFPEYAEQLEELARTHPDWHIRQGQELRWGYPQDKDKMRTLDKIEKYW